ncbi:MAG: hypothetical protein KGY54_11390 [Oleiphilaceae bacterium]|nr:hypothetical protein [Oleiphilaceae bacterium]
MSTEPSVDSGDTFSASAYRFFRRHLKTLIFLLVIFGIYLWYQDMKGPHEFTWLEEVELADDRRVWVERQVKLSYTALAGRRGVDLWRSSVEIKTPERSDWPGAWSQDREVPILIDKDPDTGEWFIVSAWYKARIGDEIQSEYRFRQGEWVKQDQVSEKLIEQRRKINLLSLVWSQDESDIGWEEKQESLTMGVSKFRCITTLELAETDDACEPPTED